MAIPVSHAPVDRVSEYKLKESAVLSIGRFSYVDGQAWILWYGELSAIRIGSFSSIATNTVFFLRTNHHPEWICTYPIEMIPWPAETARPVDMHVGQKGDISVGNDVWIGEGTRIMPGVTVSDGAVIGAGTVVTRDIPPYALVAGNPGRVKKMRFAEREIEFLLQLQWWNWPTEKIRRFAPLLCAPDIEELRRHIEA